MTIEYRRHATATRSRTMVMGMYKESTGDVAAEADDCMEIFTARSEVSMHFNINSDARKRVITRSAVVKGMIAEASDGPEQVAREYTLRILSQFSDLRQKMQREHQGFISSTNVTKFAVKAGSRMMELKMYQDFKDVGNVPGVRVGDWFSYTYELLLIGLHRHLRGNITYIPATAELSRTKYCSQSVACSIITSENDVFAGESLVFLGQGGKLRKPRAESGNLALMNSCNMRLPVRVIRRSKDSGNATGQRFTYYGLYTVDKHILDRGAHGHPVYKFYLRRQGDQPDLDAILPKSPPDPTMTPSLLLTADISEGVEQTPVRVVNAIDLNAPEPFLYSATVRYPCEDAKFPSRTLACDCNFGCKDDGCPCVRRNNGEVLAYNDDGHLIRVRDVVYECGSLCNCSNASCRNRVSQSGLKWRLEIFRTPTKGWGVRTLECIPSGSFLCELTGEMITASQAADRENDEYLFNLDFHKGAKARNKPSKTSKRQGSVEVKDRGQLVKASVDYVIDCRPCGNVTRFINHSCDPNLFVQGVLYDHDDLERGHIMLFAGEDIAAQTELAYDYGYELDSVRDHHGNVIAKECHCGANICRKRMY